MVVGGAHRDELARSGLFDADWYVANDPGLGDAAIDPIAHYLGHGAAAGRDPNPVFDADWYLAQLGGAIDTDPLTHYLRVGAAEGRDPHPLFDGTWYRGQYLRGEPAGVVPLAHYLFLWRLLDVRPNPFFDARFYLREYPDVAAGGLDPHDHYIRHGAFEGRRPSSDFDPDFYAGQISGADREAYNGRLLEHFLRHGRGSGLSPKRPTGPAHDRERDREGIVAAIDRTKPTLAMIYHDLGGGVFRHVSDLAQFCRDRVNVLFVSRSKGCAQLTLATAGPGASLRFDANAEFDGLADVLEQCGVARLHVHHLLGGGELERLVDRLSVPLDFTIHDYFLLAPQPHLVDGSGRFVGENLAAAEARLCAASLAIEPVVSLRAWRRKNRWLLHRAERVIAPSFDTARRFARYYPDLPVIVAAHIEAPVAAAPAGVGPLVGAEPLRVALLGYVAEHKGHATLIETARQAGGSGSPLSFMLIGGSIDDEALRQAGVAVTGGYDGDAELLRALGELRPHLLWYPSQCPETYCYTLSTGLRSGLPVVVPDIGAFPERISGRSWSWVAPWCWGAADWLDFFLRVRAEHFLSGVAPPPPAGIGPPPGTFYAEDYLAWARR